MNCWDTLTCEVEGDQQQHYDKGKIKLYGYVYETTCKVNGKKYIGQHKSRKIDENYLGSGTVQRRAVKKYGKDNFTIKILQVCNNALELNAAEQLHIAENNAVQSSEFYNLINYGTQCQFSAETRSKMSEAAKRRSSLPEFKQRMSKLHSGKTIPQDVILKRTETLKRTYELNGHPLKGRKLPAETVQRMIESRKGYTHSVETREKISQSLKAAFANRDQSGENNPFYGKHHSEQTRSHLSKSIKGRVHVNNGIINKQVRQSELQSYLDNGFTLGRMKSAVKRVWIHKDRASKLIAESDVNTFLQSGWVIGRK